MNHFISNHSELHLSDSIFFKNYWNSLLRSAPLLETDSKSIATVLCLKYSPNHFVQWGFWETSLTYKSEVFIRSVHEWTVGLVCSISDELNETVNSPKVHWENTKKQLSRTLWLMVFLSFDSGHELGKCGFGFCVFASLCHTPHS